MVGVVVGSRHPHRIRAANNLRIGGLIVVRLVTLLQSARIDGWFHGQTQWPTLWGFAAGCSPPIVGPFDHFSFSHSLPNDTLSWCGLLASVDGVSLKCINMCVVNL
jgi:hypothetical protein